MNDEPTAPPAESVGSDHFADAGNMVENVEDRAKALEHKAACQSAAYRLRQNDAKIWDRTEFTCRFSHIGIFRSGFDAGVSHAEQYATKQIERQGCRYCVEGYDRVASSVSDAWVHPATPIGRIVCSYEETPAESALRSLASYLGNGGYNAPRVDAKVFEDKIRSGIDSTIQAEIERQTPAIIERFVEEVEKYLFIPSGDDLFDGCELISAGSVHKAMKTVKARREGGEGK